ncbi:MAG TPA: hypothetical protein DCM54_13340 [Gammaproteobacteria bacterium]|nr:hypothetical protein [Gammaproteobacteria bacterium]
MEALAPPAKKRIVIEALTFLEFFRLVLSAPTLLRQPRGNREQVLVFPGFGASNASTSLLRRYLRYLNYDVKGWNEGTNTGDVETLIATLARFVTNQAHQQGTTITLIGWSLGGYLAREVARKLPTRVNHVFTLGSPVTGGPKYTRAGPVYERRGFDLDDIERAVFEREVIPLRVPVTALYSRRDGVVDWRACIDDRSGMTEHVDVTTTHLGFGFSAAVFMTLARRLGSEDE